VRKNELKNAIFKAKRMGYSLTKNRQELLLAARKYVAKFSFYV